MSWLFFSIGTAILWGIAELFYKKGARPDEKYSHLKICVWVGIVMGAHADARYQLQSRQYHPLPSRFSVLYHLHGFFLLWYALFGGIHLRSH